MSQQKHTAAIFDLDGVIIDSMPQHHTAWQQAAEFAEVPFVEEVFEQTFGMRNDEIIPTLFGIDEPARIQQIADYKEQQYRDAIQHAAKAIPGFYEFIQSLQQQGIKTAIATSAGKENVDMAVNTLELSPLFSDIVRGDEVERGKPAPDIFLEAARRLQTTAHQCAVFEDAIAGVQAANAAGMTSVALSTTHPASQLAMAHMVVQNFSDPALHQLF